MVKKYFTFQALAFLFLIFSATVSNDIQAMMNALQETGGEVWVAKGNYIPLHKAGIGTEEGDKSFVLVKDVKLYGNIPDISYIDTDIDGNTLITNNMINIGTYQNRTDVNISSSNTGPVKIYPNPAKDILYIDSDNNIENVSIYNMYGKLINQVKTTGNYININDLAAGNYIIQIITNQNISIYKIIKE